MIGGGGSGGGREDPFSYGGNGGGVTHGGSGGASSPQDQGQGWMTYPSGSGGNSDAWRQMQKQVMDPDTVHTMTYTIPEHWKNWSVLIEAPGGRRAFVRFENGMMTMEMKGPDAK